MLPSKMDTLQLIGQLFVGLAFVVTIIFCFVSAILAVSACICGTITFWVWLFSSDSFITVFNQVCFN